VYDKLLPASAEPFHLGNILGVPFSVTISRKSCFDGFERHTPLPSLHLIVAPDDETMTWERWFQARHLTGFIDDAIEGGVRDIVAHFFGDALPFDQAAWRVERNSRKAARRQTVHVHLKIAHQDLFGEDGLVKQCVQSDLKPTVVGEEMVRAHLEKILTALRDINASFAFKTQFTFAMSFAEGSERLKAFMDELMKRAGLKPAPAKEKVSQEQSGSRPAGWKPSDWYQGP
jgi:hypothetical protein